MTLHDGDTPVDADQLRRLLEEQRPDLADAPLQVVKGPGTDHVLLRVGDDLVARLPRNAPAAVSLDTELRWLPRLVDRLTLPLPRVEHEGVPGAGYPFAWALLSWLDGHDLCAVVLDGPVPRTWAAGADDVLTALAGRHRVGVCDGPSTSGGRPLPSPARRCCSTPISSRAPSCTARVASPGCSTSGR